METASSAGGAAVFAAILTAVLPNTLEDLLALALCAALSYASFLNWPLKRADLKASIAEQYTDLGTRLDAELVSELQQGCDKLRAEVVACLLYTSPSPRDRTRSRMPSSA